MIKAQKSWVKNKDTPKYQVGDQVWLEGCHLCTNQPTAKLAPRRHGPFKIVQVMSPVNYRLELPTQWSIHLVFHTDLLTPYRKTLTHGHNYQRPPPDLVDREEEYEVEKILDQRHFGRRHKLQYLIKWKGYPDSENQWVNSHDVFADKAIREFEQSNSAPVIDKRKGKSTRNRHLHSLLLTHMSQSPLPVHNNELPLDNSTNDYSISRIFGMLIEPEHGWVSPNFLEYQDVEGPSMKEVNTGVETGTGDMGTFPTTILISTMPTDNTAPIHCNPNDHLAPGLDHEYCHDPSHGGFYMAKGALYIRIGLPPRVVSGDCLVSSRYRLTARSLHCRRAYPMSRDWGCTSTCYQSFYIPISSMQPWGLYLHSHVRPLSW